MNTALDDIAFLASSANRVGVLDALAETPRSRDGLMADLDITRPTLGRILHDLEARMWIERRGRTYHVTPLGAMVADAFDRLLETMATEGRLRDVMPWFPTDQVPFDIECLSGAEIVVPTPTNFAAHVQRGVDALRSAQRVRVLSAQTGPEIVKATRDAVMEDDQWFEGVLTADLVETIKTDPTMAPVFAELLEAPTVDIYVSEDEIAVMFFITDGTVGLPLPDAEGIARALVLSENRTVFDWAVETFETSRARAEPVEPSAFTV